MQDLILLWSLLDQGHAKRYQENAKGSNDWIINLSMKINNIHTILVPKPVCDEILSWRTEEY